jgi:hypothetical protein
VVRVPGLVSRGGAGCWWSKGAGLGARGRRRLVPGRWPRCRVLVVQVPVRGWCAIGGGAGCWWSKGAGLGLVRRRAPVTLGAGAPMVPGRGPGLVGRRLWRAAGLAGRATGCWRRYVTRVDISY